MDIEGISAFITGAASGIGRATARRLAAAGAEVVIADLDDEAGEVVADELGGSFCHVDITDADSVIAGLDTAAEMGPLRAVVSCAGFAPAARTIGRDGSYESAHPLDLWRKVIDVNLTGTFNVLRLGATAMSRTEPLADGERGAIVNIASIAAWDGQIGQDAYAASKGGIVGLTLPAARDLAVAGIRVNAIAPGLIDTPIYGDGEAAEDFKSKLSKDVLFPKRLGHADELAGMVLAVVTNPYMNGEVVRVDGGARLNPK